MQKSSKSIRYAVIGLVVIFVCVWLAGKLHPAYVRHHLRSVLVRIEPWPASTEYSDDAWKKLISAASVYQSAKPAYADAVLSDYFRNYTGRPDELAADESKAYLLLRMMFDLPPVAASRPPLADWGGAGAHPNADGSANLGWPLTFAGGKPQLASGRGNAQGTYPAREEYDYFRYHYKARDLSQITP